MSQHRAKHSDTHPVIAMTVDNTLEQFVDRIPTNHHPQFRGLEGAFKACLQGA